MFANKISKRNFCCHLLLSISRLFFSLRVETHRSINESSHKLFSANKRSGIPSPLFPRRIQHIRCDKGEPGVRREKCLYEWKIDGNLPSSTHKRSLSCDSENHNLAELVPESETGRRGRKEADSVDNNESDWKLIKLDRKPSEGFDLLLHRHLIEAFFEDDGILINKRETFYGFRYHYWRAFFGFAAIDKQAKLEFYEAGKAFAIKQKKTFLWH